MDGRDKEVYFNVYCQKCKYQKLDEAQDPCDECLSYPVNEYSHKPVKFAEKEK